MVRRFVLSISTVCISILLSLALGEAALRMLGYKPISLKPRVSAGDAGEALTWAMRSERYGWINRPGTYKSVEAGKVPMTFLADHSRRSWAMPSKPDQKGEVLVVGCSFTQGYGVADEDTFSYLLNARYPHLMFRDFGTGGYGTYQSLLRVEQNLSAPDAGRTRLVIYGFIALHFARNVASPSWIRALTGSDGHYFVPPFVRLESNGLVYHGWQVVPWWPLETRSALITLLANTYINLRYSSSHAEEFGVGTRLIEQMAQVVSAHHQRFLIVLLDRPPNGLIEILKQQRIEYVTCDNPAFDQVPSAFRVGGVGHPNARQQGLWAGCIGEAIDSRFPDLVR